MKNNIVELKKTLQRHLKKKVTYTMKLLVSFLISGGIALASSGNVNGNDILKEEFLNNLEGQKTEIIQLIEENEKRLADLMQNKLNAVREADWYSKPWYPSYFSSIFASYKKSDSASKKWTKGIRTNTSMDGKREAFSNAMGNSRKEYSSSGWVTGSYEYNKNTHIYDYEDKMIILPVLKTFDVAEPIAPNVSFDIPKSPNIVPVVSPQMAGIHVNPVNITAPIITVPGALVPPTVIAPFVAPINVTAPNANISPININFTPDTPQLPPEPTAPSLSVTVGKPGSVEEPYPSTPDRDIDLVTPNADPFSDFRSNSLSTIRYLDTGSTASMNNALANNIDISGGIYWSGIKTDGVTFGAVSGVENPAQAGTTYIATGFDSGNRDFNKRRITIVNLYNGRWNSKTTHNITGGTFHAAGNTTGYSEYDPAGFNPKGTATFHIVGDANFSNVTSNLYGMAAFSNVEAHRGGKVDLASSVKINVKEDNNTIFNIRGRAPRQEYKSYGGSNYSTTFISDAEITVNTKKNSIYVTRDFTGGLKIENKGEIKLNGASNIGFSVLTWAPDKSKYITHTNAGGSVAGETYSPYVKMASNKSMKLSGDENIGVFFNSKTLGKNTLDGDYKGHTANYNVGIHQGEFELYFDIGTQLNSNGGTTQSSEGQLIDDGTDYKGYTDKTVDGNVGVFARSGQRTGVDPYYLYKDSLTPHTGGAVITESDIAFLQQDIIHNLILDNFEIKFGKYAKNGFMFLAENGTVIEVKSSGTQSSFSDGVDGTGTLEADASEGTIIAYSSGKWKAVNTGLTLLGTHAGVENKPTEIIIGQNLNMVSKKGIAFFAINGGKVTLNVGQKAQGLGYESIMAYAEKDGSVDIQGNIIVADSVSTTAEEKYKNIGAYAIGNGTTGGTITVTGDAEINGIGALAKGIGADITLGSANTVIRTGINGGLIALDGGAINFAGGTIKHKDISTIVNESDNTHKKKIPFYAKGTGSIITFTGPTTIEMYDGVAFLGNKADFDNSTAPSSTAKYKNMDNVTIVLKKNEVNIGAFQGETVNWTGSGGLLSAVNTITKVGNIIGTSSFTWKVSFLDGTFNITADTDYNGSGLNNVILENEKVNLLTGQTLTSTQGNSIMVSSKDTLVPGTNKNSQSVITNEGRIVVSGAPAGTSDFGAYAYHGTIINKGTVDVANGAGIYGESKSKLENQGTIKIKSGAGILGKAFRDEEVGTGTATVTTTLVEIINSGTITASGDNAVGIYSINNSKVSGDSRASVKITSSGLIDLSAGDSNVGVMVKTTGTKEGGTITLTDNGSTGIKVGKGGVGIYAEESDITLSTSGTATTYTIDIKDDGLGIYTTGDSDITGVPLKLVYSGTNTGSGIGIVYKGDSGKTLTNDIDVEVDALSTMTGMVTGIHAYNGGILENDGNLTVVNGKAYGISAYNTDVKNTGLITTGTSSNGGVGIYGRDSAIEIIGENLVIQGNRAIGIFAENDALITGKTVQINQGIGDLNIQGAESVGVYLKDKYANSQLKLNSQSKVTLIPSSSDTERRIGIYLEEVQNTGNVSSGIIEVSGNTTSGHNIGIYSIDSYLKQTGDVEVTGVNNIGISLKTTGVKTNKLELENTGKVIVNSSSATDTEASLGIYGKGNNITISTVTTPVQVEVGYNSVGIYLDGDNSSSQTGNYKYDLSSNANETIGIGSYFKGGAYAGATNADLIEISSSNTAIGGTSGDLLRPIGLFYGTGSAINNASLKLTGTNELIGIYGENLSSFTNNGNLTLNTKSIGGYFLNTDLTNVGAISIVSGANKAYGLYLKGGNSKNNATITANADDSIGAIVTDSNTVFTNNSGATITSNGKNSLGVYVEDQGKFVNNGKLDSTLAGVGSTAGSIGAFATNSTIENNGTMNVEYLGLYGKDGSTINQKGGTLTLNSGLGIYVEDTGSVANLNGGTVTSGVNSLIGVAGKSGAHVNLNGADIIMIGNSSVGISLDGAKGKLVSGNINVGASSVGVHGNNSNIDISNYTGKLVLGSSSIGLYAEDTTLTNGMLNIDYDDAAKGVGIFYKSATSVTNNVEIVNSHTTGKNLVHIYGDNTDITNNANQTIKEGSIGLIGKNGTKITNNSILTLAEDNTVGIYIDDPTTQVLGIGTIVGNAPISSGYKIGVYVDNGDILGSNGYTFSVDNGIGMYIKDVISYTGILTLNSDSIGTGRAIGIYADGFTGNLSNKLKLNGADSVGIYLKNGTNLTYNGEIELAGNSTTKRGVGAYLDTGSCFTLTGGKLKIGGVNNLGFYVDNGAILNVAGGTVNNTEEGIFAYINGGALHFTSGTPFNIDYANVIVSDGTILNDTILTTGTSGLQGTNGSTITNSFTGILKSSVRRGKALLGRGVLTVVNNLGKINLSGEESIGIYVEDGARGKSSGDVTVGKNSVAYYSAKNGTSAAKIDVTGTTIIGEGSTMFFGAGGDIDYSGNNIALSDKSTGVTLTDGGSNINLNGATLTTGKEGTGVFLSDTGNINKISNLPKIVVKENGVGVYIDNSIPFNSSLPIELKEKNAIGILTVQNTDITYGGTISSVAAGTIGIISTGAGKIENNGNLSLTGAASVGIYLKDGSLVRNNASGIINTGAGAIVGGTLSSSVGMYGKDVVSMLNDGIINLKSAAVGIYVENGVVTNNNIIQSTLNGNTGIYGIGGQVNNTAIISLGDSSTGVYLRNGSVINNSGNVTVGNNKAVGLYGAGNAGVSHQSGIVKVGKESLGVAIEDGNINIAAGAQILAGESSTYIYSKNGTGTNNSTINMSDYSIGMYTKTGIFTNNGTLTAGKSGITTTDRKISAAMATEKGKIENNGIINVGHADSIGMVATVGGKAINNSTGIINVNGAASYGMQGKGSNSTLENHGTINVNGHKARGIAATENTQVINTGKINVNGTDSEGIYVDLGATVSNTGTIKLNNLSGIGIYIGEGGIITNAGNIDTSSGGISTIKGGGTLVNVGDITINGSEATIDGITISNTGTITINGALDFGTIQFANDDGHIGTINADTFNNGEFIVLPNVTQGSNKEQYIIQYLQGANNVPNNGKLTAISQSVSFIADIQRDLKNPNLMQIVMIKIPYVKLLNGTDAVEFGKGLDEIYSTSRDTELKMFDALDMISDKDQLGSTFDTELRGNVYANIQQRMYDIDETFENTINDLRHDRLYTKDSLKIGAIISKGDIESKKPAIEDYDYRTYGVMVMKEYDHRKFGRKSSWNIGFIQTKFNFDRGSDETVYSMNLGLGYEDFIGDNKKLKWMSKADLTINRHEMDRKIGLDNGTYENNAHYWSGTVQWKNKIRRDFISESGRVKTGVFGSFNLGYGRIENFKEKGDGIFLDIKQKNMYIIRPGVGGDVTLTKYTKNGKINLIGKVSYEYELGKFYDGANEAKIKGTNAGYYSLEEPKELNGITKIGAELKYEARRGHSVGVSVTRQESNVDSTRYGINFLYRFDN